MGGDENFGDSGRFLPPEIFGNLCQMIFRDNHILRVRAAASNPEDPLAAFPPLHCLAHFVNLTGKLQSGNILQVTRRRRVVAHALVYVRAIQSPGSHANTHSICGGVRGSLDFANLKPFNATVLCNYDCFHAMDSKD
jgi:hypothetical protein